METIELYLEREIIKTETYDGYSGKNLDVGIHGAIGMAFEVGDKIEVTIRKIDET